MGESTGIEVELRRVLGKVGTGNAWRRDDSGKIQFVLRKTMMRHGKFLGTAAGDCCPTSPAENNLRLREASNNCSWVEIKCVSCSRVIDSLMGQFMPAGSQIRCHWRAVNTFINLLLDRIQVS